MALYCIVSIIVYNLILGITEFYHLYLESPKIFHFNNIMDYNNLLKLYYTTMVNINYMDEEQLFFFLNYS